MQPPPPQDQGCQIRTLVDRVTLIIVVRTSTMIDIVTITNTNTQPVTIAITITATISANFQFLSLLPFLLPVLSLSLSAL